MTDTIGFLAIEYVPDRKDRMVNGKLMGVHTSLRQDGVYADLETAQGIANSWAEDRIHPQSNTAAVEIKTINWGRDGD